MKLEITRVEVLFRTFLRRLADCPRGKICFKFLTASLMDVQNCRQQSLAMVNKSKYLRTVCV